MGKTNGFVRQQARGEMEPDRRFRFFGIKYIKMHQSKTGIFLARNLGQVFTPMPGFLKNGRCFTVAATPLLEFILISLY